MRFGRQLTGMIAIAASVVSASPSLACITIAPFHIEDVRQADTVFVGRLVGYEVVPFNMDTGRGGYALLTVRPDTVLRGEASGTIQLYWRNSTFGLPENLEFPGQILIATVGADAPSLPLRGASATVYPNERPDIPAVLQAPCASPFLLEADRETVRDVRTLLDGGTVADRPYRHVG
jgi:hypothetical protein